MATLSPNIICTRRIANKLKENDKQLNQARSEIYKLKSELKALKESKEHLEQDVKHHEEEVRSLQKKIKKLEEAIVSPTSSKNSALRRLIAESPAPAILKRPRLSNPDGNESTDTVEVVDSSLSLVDSPVSSQPLVPSVKVKTHVFASSSSNAFKFRGMPSSNRFSIFKKPWMGQLEANSLKVPPMEEMYDGHGGHSKLDEFPKPIPKLKTAKRSTQTCVTKLKKKSLSTNSLKIDTFLLSPE